METASHVQVGIWGKLAKHDLSQSLVVLLTCSLIIQALLWAVTQSFLGMIV